MADRAFRTFVESRWYRRCIDPQSRSKDHPCRRDMLGSGAVLAGVSFGKHVHSQDTYWLLVVDIVLYLNVRMWEEVDDEMLSTDDLSRESNECSSLFTCIIHLFLTLPRRFGPTCRGLLHLLHPSTPGLLPLRTYRRRSQHVSTAQPSFRKMLLTVPSRFLPMYHS